MSYISGERQGSNAREVEKRAQSDPFLADSIEGYDRYRDQDERNLSRIYCLRRSFADKRYRPKNSWLAWLVLAVAFIIVTLIILLWLTRPMTTRPDSEEVIAWEDTIEIYGGRI